MDIDLTGLGLKEANEQLEALCNQLAKEKKILETTLLAVGDGVISCDRDGTVLFLNKVAEFLTGWQHEEAKGKNYEEVFQLVNEFSREKHENIVKKVVETKSAREMAEYTLLISKDGTERPVEDSATPVIEDDGEVSGVVIVFRDYSTKRQKLEQIQYLSYHDQLTGLYNRRFYEEELDRLDTERNWPLSIIMGDINGLKLINDSFGHAMGDQLIKKVAEVLKQACRNDEIIARVGGDEFVVLLPKTDPTEAEEIIRRIKEACKIEKVDGIEVSVSFGADSKIQKDEEFSEIFKKAEDRMYQEKLFESPRMKTQTIDAILKILSEKNEKEMVNPGKVSEMLEDMGHAVGLNPHKIELLKNFGALHDIGKIGVEDDILYKPGKLTEEELEEVKRHSEIGYKILSMVGDMSEMAEYVLYHHEKWNGKGYPKGLKQEEIPIESRIIAIVDAYESMSSERSYRQPLTHSRIIEELERNAGSQFDPDLVFIFIKKVIAKNL